MSRINSTLVLIFTAIFIFPVFAQDADHNSGVKVSEQQKIENAIQNYKMALESDNLGMIESAIINVMKLKHHYPEYNYSSLIPVLDYLEKNNQSTSVRFMSYIVKNYLVYPDRYAWLEKAELEFNEDLYVIIAQKVTEQVEE